MKDTEPERPEHSMPKLYVNYDDWLPYFEDFDIPLEEKRAWIDVLWSIQVSFVDLGFGLTATEQICGEVIDLKAVLDAAVVRSDEAHNKDGKEDAA